MENEDDISILPIDHKCGNLSYITSLYERHHFETESEVAARAAARVACHQVGDGRSTSFQVNVKQGAKLTVVNYLIVCSRNHNKDLSIFIGTYEPKQKKGSVLLPCVQSMQVRVFCNSYSASVYSIRKPSCSAQPLFCGVSHLVYGPLNRYL